MSRVAPCNFCAHDNPDGSRFCNECGSQLNLFLCSECEAINSRSAKQCFQCGAPLALATGEMATPLMALTETAQSAEGPATKGDPGPATLAEPLQALRVHPDVVLAALQSTVDDEPSLAPALIADPAKHDEGDSSRLGDAGGAAYPGRSPNRALGFFLLVAFVAVAGAIYWSSVNRTRPPDPQTITSGARTTAPEAASSAPAAAPRTADTAVESPTGGSLPAAASRPSPAGPSGLPAAAGESSQSAKAPPATAGSSESPATILPHMDAELPAAGQPPVSADTRASSPAGAAESAPKTTNARAANDTGRTVIRDRAKEQAERDAIATRRLIARELADLPPADSDDRLPPRP